jgi:hypothetical protein
VGLEPAEPEPAVQPQDRGLELLSVEQVLAGLEPAVLRLEQVPSPVEQEPVGPELGVLLLAPGLAPSLAGPGREVLEPVGLPLGRVL